MKELKGLMDEGSKGADASKRVALLVRVAADGVDERRQFHQMPLALRLQLRSDPQLLHLPDAWREARSGPGRCGLTALFLCWLCVFSVLKGATSGRVPRRGEYLSATA